MNRQTVLRDWFGVACDQTGCHVISTTKPLKAYD